MRKRVCHHTFLYPSAAHRLASGLHVDGRCRRGADTIHLGFRYRHLHLYRAHVKNRHHSLRGQCRLAGLHSLASHDAAHGSHKPAVGQILPRHFQLRLSLSHAALNLHPLRFGQRTGLVQHRHALQAVVGLCHRGLSTGQHIACLCIVHLGNQLSAAYSLPLAHQHTAHHTHTREAHRRCLALLYDTHVLLSRSTGLGRHHLRLHPRRLFHLRLLFLAAAAHLHHHGQGRQHHFCFHS